MLKRICYRILELGQQYAPRAPTDIVRQSTNMERMFGDCAPAIVAFKIDNGYVVRSVNVGPAYEIGGSPVSGFTYCKDHQAIADHIVSEAAREKVMPKQQTMSYGSPHANQASASAKYAR